MGFTTSKGSIMSFAAVVSVFSLAFVSFWPAIPSGIALGLTPLVVILTTSISYAAGVALVLLVGKPLQSWLARRFDKTVANPDSLVRRAWQRFGVIGLGLLAPMTVGAQVGAVIGLALNVPPRRLFIWMVSGAILWSIGLTAAVQLGLVGVRALG
jgi:hypothetical protein